LKRIGLFGGTFDPIHLGHLWLARLAILEGRLDRLYFLPAFAPPHKEGRMITDFQERVEMVRIALVGEEKMTVCLVEEQLPPPSYTIKTLRHLAAGDLADGEIFFIIGADSLLDLPNWRDYEEILATTHIIVAARRGCGDLAAMAGMARRLGYRLTDGRWLCPGKKEIFFLSGQLPTISSSALRALLQRGRVEEAAAFLPVGLAAWLRERRLYRY
jgi:nicotinate-nucleotide adenylyltransferase